MNRTHPTAPIAMSAVLVLNGAVAATAAESTHREHGAHEHGHGVLEVVTEGAELLVALRVPAVNAVGFEHAPGSEQQHRLVEETIARLRLGEPLFIPSVAAGCRLVSADVQLAGMEGGSGEADRHDAHGKGASSSDDHDDRMEAGHAELHAGYHFRCADPARLEAMEVRVFGALKDVEAIKAQVVTETFQGAAELTAASTTLKLVR